jgi:hypothetical protein
MKPFAIGAARLAALGFTVSGCIPQPWLASAGPRGYRRNQSKYQFATDRRCVVLERLSAVELLDGSWRSAPNHSRPASCVIEADIDAEDQPDSVPQKGQ